jgi:hypothetical protein
MAIEIPKHVTDWLEAICKDSYQKGWDGAMAAVMAAASSQHGATARAAIAQQTNNAPPRHRARLPQRSNRELVIEALRAKPGMRPRQVVVWLLGQGHKVIPNTILTMIKRMRKDETLVKRGEGYMLNENAAEKAA